MERTVCSRWDDRCVLRNLLGGGSLHLWRLGPAEDTPIYRTPWDGVNVVVQRDGADTRFDRAPTRDGHPHAGNKGFTSEEEAPTLVEHSNGTRTLTYGEYGQEWLYGAGEFGGYPYEIIDPSREGNTLALSYASEKLAEISDTHGHTLAVTRNPSTSYVAKINSGSGEEWSYGYDERARLTSYKGPEGHEAHYGYYGEGALLKDIVEPAGTWVISYDEAKRVTSLRKIVNGTIETPGNQDEVTAFTYGSRAKRAI